MVLRRERESSWIIKAIRTSYMSVEVQQLLFSACALACHSLKWWLLLDQGNISLLGNQRSLPLCSEMILGSRSQPIFNEAPAETIIPWQQDLTIHVEPLLKMHPSAFNRLVSGAEVPCWKHSVAQIDQILKMALLPPPTEEINYWPHASPDGNAAHGKEYRNTGAQVSHTETEIPSSTHTH